MYPDIQIEAMGTAPKGMVWIRGGEFQMGSDVGHDDEAPVHKVVLDGYWMDETEVTNAQFSEFVKATGYITVAERKPKPTDFPGVDPSQLNEELLVPGALVHVPTPGGGEWQFVAGASWSHPEGPGFNIDAKMNHPVVQVAYEDAKAYADWAGKELDRKSVV